MSLKKLVDETKGKVAFPTWEVIDVIVSEIEQLKAKSVPKPKVERPRRRAPT